MCVTVFNAERHKLSLTHDQNHKGWNSWLEYIRIGSYIELCCLLTMCPGWCSCCLQAPPRCWPRAGGRWGRSRASWGAQPGRWWRRCRPGWRCTRCLTFSQGVREPVKKSVENSTLGSFFTGSLNYCVGVTWWVTSSSHRCHCYCPVPIIIIMGGWEEGPLSSHHPTIPLYQVSTHNISANLSNIGDN